VNESPILRVIEERIVDGSNELPIFHPVALKLQRILSQNEYSMKEIAKTIQQDQALVTTILRVSNSSFYSGLKPIKTIQHAAVRLGAKSIVNLVMMATQKQMYQFDRKEMNGLVRPLWNHALGTAIACRWLALNLGFNTIVEESFLAGLLHDIGKLFLLKVIDDEQKNGSIPQSILDSVIHDILASMHAKQGERVLKHLNMPEEYCQSAAMHHDEEIPAENIIVNVVSLANLTCRKMGIGPKSDPGLMLSTTSEAINLRASDLLLAQLQVYIEENNDKLENVL
jgi:HD-like signal output (HDOD) protein